jgi:hypothetical protein
MITTIRSIGQFSAENFNDSFTKNLLSYNSNQYTSIAQEYLKNNNQTQQPMLFYRWSSIDACHPKTEKIDKVNDVPVTQTIDDFKSLAKWNSQAR